MLYTIGYQNLKNADELIRILKEKGIQRLVDVRSKPIGRNASFRKPHLKMACRKAGIVYHWKGATLGGFGDISASAIFELFAWQQDKRACLMCMEADPDQCHRSYEIAKRLHQKGLNVIHILTAPGMVGKEEVHQ